MRVFSLVAMVVIVSLSVVLPQSANGQLPQPQFVIDKPTAGMLPDQSYMLNGRAGAESSFLFGMSIGFKELIQFGLSYGAQNVFDNGNPAINDYPGFQARIRIVGESEKVPALAIGFNSQGQGVYHRSLERYDRKSVGFYAVASKNYALMLGEISVHGGLSLSTERKDDNDPTIFGSSEWVLFERLSFLLAVDGALNDNENTSFGQGGVYVDAGVGWYFGEFANITLAFRDLTDNFGPMPGVSRELQFTLIKAF